MGLLTLNELRDELGAQFGDRGVGNERLTRWINMAYFKLCAQQEFEKLKCQQEIDTIEGIYEYSLPEKFLGFVSVLDVDNKYRLKRITLQDVALHSLDEEAWGPPTKWALREDAMLLLTVPDDEYEIRGIYIKEPTRLEDPSDVTIIPSIWDATVILYAKYFGLTAFNQFQEANIVLQQAAISENTTKKDQDWLEPTPAGGLDVAWSEADLTDQS